ncbi:MAG: NADH-quinone oxidoreductase subunit NuoH [Anaerolineaceae bacterium]|nr:NADH-quinone oxidoreductase subunit NuoH [Anaerolineaceae bacterium]
MSFFADPVNFIIDILRSLLLGWGISSELTQFVMYFLGAGILAALPMFMTLWFIWAERKILGRIQDRLGPNRVGPWGIFQTIADMIKIFTKELAAPDNIDKIPYNLAPILAVAGVLLLWAVIPFTTSVVGVNLNVGVLYLIAVGGLGSLGFVFAGWGSNNKYALIGAFRAIAQLISYEIPMAVTLLIPVMFTGSMGMVDIVKKQDIWYIFLSPLGALIFFIATIAEIGRSPFDLLEADSELVSGFNIEYAGLKFGMFYVADFLHAFTLSLIFTSLFLGGWRGPFVEQVPVLGFAYLLAKTVVVWFVGIWIRGSMPRFRIDQMLNLNWKVLTPLSLSVLMCTALVDKLFPGIQDLFRVAILLLVNILLYLITDWLMRRSSSNKPRSVVALEPYSGQKTGIKDVSA